MENLEKLLKLFDAIMNFVMNILVAVQVEEADSENIQKLTGIKGAIDKFAEEVQ